MNCKKSLQLCNENIFLHIIASIQHFSLSISLSLLMALVPSLPSRLISVHKPCVENIQCQTVLSCWTRPLYRKEYVHVCAKMAGCFGRLPLISPELTHLFVFLRSPPPLRMSSPCFLSTLPSLRDTYCMSSSSLTTPVFDPRLFTYLSWSLTCMLNNFQTRSRTRYCRNTVVCEMLCNGLP